MAKNKFRKAFPIKLLSLPAELFFEIKSYLRPKDITKLKKKLPELVARLVAYERSPEADKLDELGCYSCLEPYPRWKFANA
jgi:hypothetical protein